MNESQSFSERLNLFIEKKNISVREFERICDIGVGVISKLIRANSTIGNDKLTKIVNTYPEINLRWLLIGEGEMEEIENKYEVIPFNDKLGEFNKALYNIPIVGSASAGYIVGYGEEYEREYLELFSLAFHQEQLQRGFTVQGDSMMYELNDGDVVFCRRVLDVIHHIFKRQNMYVLVCGEGVIVKHLKKEEEQFIAIPANPHYSSYSIPFSEILELWMVEWSLRRRK